MVAYQESNHLYSEINVYNHGYIKKIYFNHELLTNDKDELVDYNSVICNKCCYDIHYIRSRSFDEIKGSDYKGLIDEYWQCPHKRIFFSEQVHSPQIRTIGNNASWFDVMADEDKLKKEIKKASKVASTTDIDEPESDSEEEIGSILKEFESKINDPRYKKEEDMKKYFNNQIDKKRFAGKKWVKELEKPCKYALRAFASESIATYKFVNPKTGKKDKLRYAECWQWECTGPITGKVYDLHICNCVHPGEKDQKGHMIWRDEWLCDPKFVFVYDRLEDWYKWDYSFSDMRWIYNAEKENCPLTNRKKGLIPGSGEIAKGFSNGGASDGASDGARDGAKNSSSVNPNRDGWTSSNPGYAKHSDGRGSPTSATVMHNIWSRNSRASPIGESEDGWSTPLKRK
jgi:hypothetical protein